MTDNRELHENKMNCIIADLHTAVMGAMLAVDNLPAKEKKLDGHIYAIACYAIQLNEEWKQWKGCKE